MRKVVMPLLSIVLGTVQLLFIFIAYMLTLAWYLSPRVTYHQFMFSKHGIRGSFPDMVLGYMDGTHGVLSWLLPYEAALMQNGRVRLVNIYHVDFEWNTKIVNGWTFS